MKKQLSQARKAMFSLSSKVKQLMLPIDVQLDFFYKLVLPVLSYGSEVWGYEDLPRVEFVLSKVHYRKIEQYIMLD